MKRNIILIVAILVLAQVMLSSCGTKGAFTEQQVVQMTYDYLATRAGQLQSTGEVEKLIISRQFWDAVFEAEHKLDVGDLGDLVYMQFDEPSSGQLESLKIHISTGALKRIAKYHGDGLWTVYISDWDWQVNERTGEVIAQNEEAVQLLAKITLKTYHSDKYGYYIDYPPSWTIYEENTNKVWIFSSTDKAYEAFIYIHVIEEGDLAVFKGLQGYIVARLDLMQTQYYEFELIKQTTTRIDYIYRIQKDSPRHEAKLYFTQHNGMVYGILCSAETTVFTAELGSLLYDPFDSFRFQP